MLKWILESPFWRCDVYLRIFGFRLIADLSYGNTEFGLSLKGISVPSEQIIALYVSLIGQLRFITAEHS
jgi:hypothetical protein